MVRVGIGGRIHDEARVVSANFSLSPKGGLAPLRDRLAEQLDMTVRWAEENGAFIGHVKAYIRWGEAEALMLSTTGEGTQAKGSPVPPGEPNVAEIGGTAIVFGVGLEAAEERLRGLAAAVAGRYGEPCVFERAHGRDGSGREHEHGHGREHDPGRRGGLARDDEAGV